MDTAIVRCKRRRGFPRYGGSSYWWGRPVSSHDDSLPRHADSHAIKRFITQARPAKEHPQDARVGNRGLRDVSGRLVHSQSQLPTNNDPAANREIQAIPLQTSTVDGQTSWLIEPDVPRIPKVPGLDPQLPPHIERRLSYAFDLAQRGATYTADAEFRAVLGLCALEMDAREGGTARRESLREGLMAMQEADQFGGDQLDWRDAADVRSVAAGHVTPVLRQAQGPVDSIQAVQSYYVYAEQRLVQLLPRIARRVAGVLRVGADDRFAGHEHSPRQRKGGPIAAGRAGDRTAKRARRE